MRVGFPILILAFFAALVYVTWHLWRITPGGWPAKVLVTGLFLLWMALAFSNMPLSEKVSVRAAQRQYADQAHRFTFVTFNTVAPNVKTVIDDAPVCIGDGASFCLDCRRAFVLDPADGRIQDLVTGDIVG